MKRIGHLTTKGRYHEPFIGGGALFFGLFREGRLLTDEEAFLSDTNLNLIEVYEAIKDDVEALIEQLRLHEAAHCNDYYYQVRKEVPDLSVARAARVIYLNKTCFNGLYRENSKGLFNVPIGRYKKTPTICDQDNLHAVSKALKQVEISARSFESILDCTEKGDFVYFDPPYHPLTETASFTAYAKGGFGVEEQRRLADVFAQLDGNGVRVLLSNSSTPLIEELYGAFKLKEVSASRAVNSKANRRGPVMEVLVSNF